MFRITIAQLNLTVGDIDFPAGVTPMLEPEKHIVHITFIKEEEAEGEEAAVDADGAEPEDCRRK